MRFSGWKSIALGILGTLLLGALGSGLWEIGLKPGAIWLGKAILTVATFGSDAVRDQIYREAAKGPHEASSIEVFRLLVLSTFMGASFIFGMAQGERDGRKERQEFEKSIDNLETDQKITILNYSLAKLYKNLHRARLGLAGVVLFFACVEMISYLKVSQANAAYTFFAQSITICQPHISETETQTLNSRFASIKGRDDFLSIMEDLKHTASLNHLELPEFNPW